MVYADPRNDITSDVVYNLNRLYKATTGSAARTAPGAAAPPANGAPAAGAQGDGH
jgi:hypothetical protein